VDNSVNKLYKTAPNAMTVWFVKKSPLIRHK